MGELNEFVMNVFNNLDTDSECSFFINDTLIELIYDAEDNKFIFEITYDDYESKSGINRTSIASEKFSKIISESGLGFEYDFFDGMGCPFCSDRWTINVLSINRDILIKFITDLEFVIHKLELKRYTKYKEKNILKRGYSVKKRNVKFRPKARLLSVLGEQLISSEIIAIKEMILNAFDADADKVYLDFIKDKNGKVCEITLLDNGIGMSEDDIINGWFIPATSHKTRAKKMSCTKGYNRPIMGEKGVGRFACRRIGESIELITRPIDEDEELFFNIEWSQYDVDEYDIFLDNIENTLYSKAKVIDQSTMIPTINNFNNGTYIKIGSLFDKWDDAKIDEIKKDLLKFIPPFYRNNNFTIIINGVELNNDIFIEKALFYLEGVVDNKGNFYYMLGTYPRKHNLKPGELLEIIDFDKDIESQILQLPDTLEKECLLESELAPKAWKEYIDGYISRGINRNSEPLCGNFSIAAYAWDLDSISRKKVGINDRNSRELLRSFCGMSIYRDGFRVWPYGSAGNDWLDLNKRAQGGQKPFHIANDQVIGYVSISQKQNPYFVDKTNREGLIEKDLYFEDFKKLVTLGFRRLEDLRHRNNSRERPFKEKEWWQVDSVLESLNKLKENIKNKAPELENDVNNLCLAYNERKIQTESKINTMLEVSSTGIVYESVTHELISFLNKMDEQSKEISNSLNDQPPNFRGANEANILLNEALKIVLYEVKELQPYFKAARYQLKEIDIKEISEKAMRYFKYKLLNNKVDYTINEITPMKKKAVEGFLLQIFTNLIDNSIYWLDYDVNNNKHILITIDGDNNNFYFSDNGKGIKLDDAPYLFDPFFTRKEGGRGLGLYIVQELLSNYRGTISISNEFMPRECLEKNPGTCFKISLP